MSEHDKSSYLFGGNAIFIEELYLKYLENPQNVDASWQDFFAKNPEIGQNMAKIVSGPSWHERGVTILNVKEEAKPAAKEAKNVSNTDSLYYKALRMIEAFRNRGHNLATLDPLNLEKLPSLTEIKLNLTDLGFESGEENKEIDLKGEIANLGKIKISELHRILQQVYCGNATIETAHLRSEDEKKWLYEKFESLVLNRNLPNEDKKHILKSLIETEGFEQFLHVRFQGTKRFSIEGGESTIIAAEQILEQAANLGIKRAVFGMAHRGRLNMLTKVMGKPYKAMIAEFAGTIPFPSNMDILGDVKYHLGYSSTRKTFSGKEIGVSMIPNPSHLETVDPVVAGKVKAEQDRICTEQQQTKQQSRQQIMGVLLHGDAAFCGQGVVAENFVISEVDGYNTGGIVHIITNNQVGFTANPKDGRASRYPSEFAKIVATPIIHVNGSDPLLVALMARLMVEYRQTFNKDIVMNLVCFRAYGHNENDEPFFTQPLMYEKIANHPSVVVQYATQLSSSNIVTASYVEETKHSFRAFLEQEFESAKTYKVIKGEWLEGKWNKCQKSDSVDFNTQPITGVTKAKLTEIGSQLTNAPEGFNLNSKVARQLEAKKKMFETGKGFDWATAEALAFGSLIVENIPVRLSGQDCGRGTFSHRHSVFHDQKTAARYMPLNNLVKEQNYYQVYDSPLSEYAVMGFEYGYALAHPDSLVLWEGQFGDFVNGAQIIIDQYIASAETKWLRQNGLVLLLPNAWEGQGPEHTSARLERFLQLCAEDNMSVAYPTTPASYFHLLRRQIKRNYRKPLIIMSPKSLLRHKLVVSDLAQISENTKFSPIISEIDSHEAKDIKKLVLCSGKFYYDLYEERNKLGRKDIAIVRLEQLYPFPEKEIKEQLEKYNKAELIWCQEEPKNMGAYQFIMLKMMELLDKKMQFIGRKEASSPATGYSSTHNKEQAEILSRLFN